MPRTLSQGIGRSTSSSSLAPSIRSRNLVTRLTTRPRIPAACTVTECRRARRQSAQRMSIARNGLKHAHAVAFGVKERDVLAHARYLHRLAQHIAAGLGHLAHRGLNVIDRDDDVRMLRRPVGP